MSDPTTGCYPPSGTQPGTMHLLAGGRKPQRWWWSGEAWHVSARNPYHTTPLRMMMLGWSYLRPADEPNNVQT